MFDRYRRKINFLIAYEYIYKCVKKCEFTNGSGFNVKKSIINLDEKIDRFCYENVDRIF